MNVQRLGRMLGIGTGNFECGCVDRVCCDCWKEGCGLNGCFAAIADGLETINPFMEAAADFIWIMGSPLAFPLIFCFSPGPETSPHGGGWQISVLQAPCRRPLQCCFYTLCAPCGQWQMRRQALGGDMTQYRLWQGMHDGPHCMARRCPGAPITIQSGTYGEQHCPNTFLCLEVWCLGGCWSVCCAFDVTRRLIRQERNLGTDPTEERVQRCIGFFSKLAHQCCMLSCCVCLGGCLVGCCAPDSEGAQECSGEAGRAARSCRSCAATCWRGILVRQALGHGLHECATTVRVGSWQTTKCGAEETSHGAGYGRGGGRGRWRRCVVEKASDMRV